MADNQQTTPIEVGKRAYSATSCRDGKPVAVRFSRGYGEDAHRAWAAAGLAPQLHRVVRLAGGWLQVEMEWLGAADGWQQELAWIQERPPPVLQRRSTGALMLQQPHGVRAARAVGASALRMVTCMQQWWRPQRWWRQQGWQRRAGGPRCQVHASRISLLLRSQTDWLRRAAVESCWSGVVDIYMR